MKQYERELEYSFLVSAAQTAKLFKDGVLTPISQEKITQTWLEQGEVGGYKIRRRIRKTEALTYGWIKYEYTTKYSKNDERAAAQDNMELNAKITPQEYNKLLRIYSSEADVETVEKIRTYFKPSENYETLFSVYSIDIYPGKAAARIEIEFTSEKEMRSWKAPDWLKEILLKDTRFSGKWIFATDS